MINLLIALNAEAKPIRQALGLKSIQDSAPWRCYANDEYRLVVTGVGRLNMAMATSWLYGAYGLASLWVNIGSAGHKDVEVGRVVIANKVEDGLSGEICLIPILSNNLPVASVKTVDSVQGMLSDDVYYDMEAAGFIQATRRVTDRERAHAIKVVSDNGLERTERLDERQLEAIIESATEKILVLIHKIDQSLNSATPQLAQEPFALAELRRVSSAQAHRWNELSRRWSALAWPVQDLQQGLSSHRSTTDFLDWMENELKSKPVSLKH